MTVLLEETPLAVIAAALADTIGMLADSADELADLTVVPYRVAHGPTPLIDIYAADPSQDYAAFGARSKQTFWTVRARVATADSDGQQLLLLALMAPSGETSLERAVLEADWDQVADGVQVAGPTGLRLFQDLGSEAPLFGVEWHVTVFTWTGPQT